MLGLGGAGCGEVRRGRDSLMDSGWVRLGMLWLGPLGSGLVGFLIPHRDRLLLVGR
jgi:hypothetical protein